MKTCPLDFKVWLRIDNVPFKHINVDLPNSEKLGTLSSDNDNDNENVRKQ